MNILVACEESQRVCTAFRAKGHRAFSCDVVECSGGHPEWHIQSDVIPLLNGNCTFKDCAGGVHEIRDKWDMIIAFPPCTYFTVASACRLFHKDENGVSHLDEERYKKGLEMKELFMNIYNANCEKIVMENPTPMKIWELPKHTQVIQPYEFGEPFSKRTLLWIKGLPELKPTEIVKEYRPYVNAGTFKYNGEKREYTGVANSKKDRSKTFIGVAKAMAEQWG